MRPIGYGASPCVLIDGILNFKDANGVNNRRLEGMAVAYDNLGAIQQERGNVSGARELWTRALELYRQIGMKHMVEQVQSWLDELPDGE